MAEDGVLDRFLESREEGLSLEGTFHQVREVASLDEAQESDGKLWVAPGGKFRMQTGEPVVSAIVSDGEEIMAVSKTRLGYLRKELDRDDPRVGPMLGMLGGDAAAVRAMIERDFEVGDEEVIEKGRIRLKLLPKSAELKGALIELTMEFSGDGRQLLGFEMKDVMGGSLRIEMGEVIEGGEIAEEVFDAEWGIPESKWRPQSPKPGGRP